MASSENDCDFRQEKMSDERRNFMNNENEKDELDNTNVSSNIGKKEAAEKQGEEEEEDGHISSSSNTQGRCLIQTTATNTDDVNNQVETNNEIVELPSSDEHVGGTSNTTTILVVNAPTNKGPLLDFTDLLKEVDEQLQQLSVITLVDDSIISRSSGHKEEEEEPAFSKTTDNDNNTSIMLSSKQDRHITATDESLYNNSKSVTTTRLSCGLDDTLWDIGVSSSTSTPLMSNVPCNKDDKDSETLLVPEEPAPEHLNISNNMDSVGLSSVQDPRLLELQDRRAVVEEEGNSPEKSFLWYYPKSLFITTTTANTNESSTNSYNNRWWWNMGATNTTTNDSNHKDDFSSRAYPQDAEGSSSSSLLRKELQNAFEQQQQQQSNGLDNTTTKLAVVRNSTTGCTAIQLGEETFRITISIPEATVSQVIYYVSNPDTLSSWCDAVITSTTDSANPASTTRHVQNTKSLLVLQESNNNEKFSNLVAQKTKDEDSPAQQQQQQFDAEWFESTVTLRIHNVCSCYNMWVQLSKLSPHSSESSSSQLTLFVDHRRSRISITYILGGCEVNHTYTFTSASDDKGAQNVVHIKDTLRVIPLGSSSNNNCYRCIRPFLRKYFFPNVQSHMKQAMVSLENLQLHFMKGHRDKDNNQQQPSVADDLTTPLLRST